MILKQFLLDRISEDEELAETVLANHRGVPERWDYGHVPIDGALITKWSPWRILAGCVSKRLIVKAHTSTLPESTDPTQPTPGNQCTICGDPKNGPAWPCYTLRAMALEWADHADYRILWRPPHPPDQQTNRPETV